MQAEGQRNYGEAIQRFEPAAKVDPKFAELQFRWGRCLLGLTNITAAREHFQFACDSDALPFRTDSRLNDIIKAVGRQHTSTNLVLLDASAALETKAASVTLGTRHSTLDTVGILGKETFYEHVHLTFDGNYRLALAWAMQIEAFLPPTIKNRTAPSWGTQETCERQLGLTDQKRALVLQSIIKRLEQPPFSNQSNNNERRAELRAQERELHR